MSRIARIAGVALLAAGLVSAGAAQAADPGLHQIYQAAAAGRLDEAQSQMAQVLRDHPRSGKAHYVEAELLARQGRLSDAAAELATAQRLARGLPFAKAQSVRELEARIAGGPAQRQSRVSMALPAMGAGALSGRAVGIPWNLLIVGLALAAVVILVFRALARRTGSIAMSPRPASYGTATAMPGYGNAPLGHGSSGIGGGILGGLATGAAVSAGMVAGEAIMHHFSNSSVGSASAAPLMPDVPEVAPDDMGGQDFGVTDGGSWDDGGGSDAGGFDGGAMGDDWS